MKALPAVALVSLLSVVTLQRSSAEDSLEDASIACSFAAPVAPADGSAMLQHSKNHAVEGVLTSFSAQGSEEGAPGGGTSIFKIEISELDTQAFHVIFCFMIMFTIGVDRLQKAVAVHAKASVVEARLMNRVNAELMMFGIVGLSIFVITNLYSSIPSAWTLYITFADIFASLAACSMIGVTVILYWFKTVTLPFLEKFEETGVSKEQKRISRRGMSEVQEFARARSGIFKGLGQHQYNVMSMVFAKKYNIPEDVLYVQYLSSCLVHNACDIMDIHWTSWMVILIFSVLSVINRFVRSTTVEHPFFHYVVMYSILNYVFLACSIIIFLAVNENYNKMFDELVLAGDVEEEDLKFENPMPEDFGKRTKFGMQVITLLNAFSFAMFIMTWLYNLSKQNAHWCVYLVLLLPPILSTLIILPLTIFRFTLVHSFYVPNQNALDELFEQYDRLEDDLNYLGRLYERKGRPEIAGLKEGCTEKQLAKNVRSLGLHISDTRMHRIFKALDRDNSGDIDASEFFDIIKAAGDVAASSPRGRYTDSVGIKAFRGGSASLSSAGTRSLVSPRGVASQGVSRSTTVH